MASTATGSIVAEISRRRRRHGPRYQPHDGHTVCGVLALPQRGHRLARVRRASRHSPDGCGSSTSMSSSSERPSFAFLVGTPRSTRPVRGWIPARHRAEPGHKGCITLSAPHPNDPLALPTADAAVSSVVVGDEPLECGPTIVSDGRVAIALGRVVVDATHRAQTGAVVAALAVRDRVRSARSLAPTARDPAGRPRSGRRRDRAVGSGTARRHRPERPRPRRPDTAGTPSPTAPPRCP